MIEVQGYISEINFRYPSKMGGYTTLMSYMNELGEIGGKGWY